MNFDITQPPPSAEALAQARQSAAEVLARQEQRGRRFNLVGYATLLLGVIFLLSDAFIGLISFDMAVAILAGWAISILILIGATAARWRMASVMPLVIPFGLSLLLSDALFPSFAPGWHGFLSLLFFAFWFSFVVGVIAFLLALVVDFFYPHGIFWTSDEDRLARDNLTELNASVLAESCIDYMAYVDQHPEIRAYQNAVLAMRRKPVVGEYRAAKVWAALFEEQAREKSKTDLAQKACLRMTGCYE